MDARAAKLALARKKLKDHQEKKHQENISYTDPNISSNMLASDDQENNQVPKIENEQSSAVMQYEEIDDNSNKKTLEGKQYNSGFNNNPDVDFNATEILISNKRSLEIQINSLQAKLIDLENHLTTTTHKYDISCHKVNSLENDFMKLNYKYQAAMEQLMLKDTAIMELNDLKSSLLDQKNNLKEQLEFTKSILTGREAENDSLHSQMFNIQNQLDATQLKLQQLTNGINSNLSDDKTSSLKYENEVLLQKVSSLEQQLKIQLKDYQQLNNHYEHYVGELNNQLKQVTKKNEELTREIQNLSNREFSLIEQIGDMEIQVQNYKQSKNVGNGYKSVIATTALDDMQESYEDTQRNLQDLRSKYEELQKLYAESRAEIENLIQSKELDAVQGCSENVSLLKLNADITSDKIAAQRATEQNKKLKQDIQGLEDAFVKMTKDKLELTEKITAEKFLNRELTIKLAEIDEKASDMQKKLQAKDEEMIRLQTSNRVVEEKYNEIAEHLRHLNGDSVTQNHMNNENEGNDNEEEMNTNMNSSYNECKEHGASVQCKNIKVSSGIPKENAMVKLQERFLKIMDEVADLSDEKHRLEHIITQLQNETDTICEYVALYQQQRCLLKKRDEERSAQMKMFQSECTRLQSQLDELTGILTRFAEDKELSAYFQVEKKHEDIQKVMHLLSKLKTNALIDPQKSIKFNDFYPCSCCSGQLIEV